MKSGTSALSSSLNVALTILDDNRAFDTAWFWLTYDCKIMVRVTLQALQMNALLHSNYKLCTQIANALQTKRFVPLLAKSRTPGS